VKEAPITEAVAELTGVRAEFDTEKAPNPAHLHAALDVKARRHKLVQCCCFEYRSNCCTVTITTCLDDLAGCRTASRHTA
jgi:hypothetical protein